MGAILSAAMLGHQPDPAQYYPAMAREAVLLRALKEACKEIEQWAAYAFRSEGDSQVDFERMWQHDDKATYDKWEALKTVAGLELTELVEPVLSGDNE